MRIPEWLIFFRKRREKVKRKLKGELGREPLLEEVAEALEVKPEKLGKAQPPTVVFLEEMCSGGDGDDGRKSSWTELLTAPEEGVEEQVLRVLTERDLREKIGQWIGSLKKEEKVVLKMRLEGCTFDEIGERMGFSRENARRLYYKAIAALRREARKVPPELRPDWI